MLDFRTQKLQEALEGIIIAMAMHEHETGHKLVKTDMGVWCSYPGCLFKRFWGTIRHQLRTGEIQP